MALRFCLGVALLLSLWSTSDCTDLSNGILYMECHERYFMIAVNLSFTGGNPWFEAADETGVYPITEQYAAKCGYTVGVLPLHGVSELRASYFSCHTERKNDDVFVFRFNLIMKHEQEVTYALNKTCSPPLPWSPREVTCEENYMEVTVRSEITCPSGKRKDDWNSLKSAHGSTTSDWQVMFRKGEVQLPPMSLSEARGQGYVFTLTGGRLVFRTPYGQPDSLSTEVNGVPVEAVHVTLYSRQSWVVLMVDLVAACSIHKGFYDGGYMVWQTPEMLYPSLFSKVLNMGLNGELVEQPVAEKGYIVENRNTTIQLSIPYNAEGRYRKSLLLDDLYDIYGFNLYFEQILVDEDQVTTRLRYWRTMATPLLPRPLFTDNRTVLEERTFMVYLRDIPDDVMLTAVNLNGEEFAVPFSNASSHTLIHDVHPNNTHCYTLKVAFDDPVVQQQFYKEAAVLRYALDINYTLTVLPENESFRHPAAIVAVITDVSPPAFETACSESGISFTLDHQPYDYLWELNIGSDPLTLELAAQHGYVMSNNSQTLQLHVPLFTHGYKYENVTLKGFFGTFEILVRDRETAEVQRSSVKTCPFAATEFIMCSTDGRMTVVADLSLAVPSGGVPARITLRNKSCRPKELDDTRALFSFPLNNCGTTAKIKDKIVIYENRIFNSKKHHNTSSAVERATLQCMYSLAGLNRLFSQFRFESDTAGVGRIIHATEQQIEDLGPIPQSTTALTTIENAFLAAQQNARRELSRLQNLLTGIGKGVKGSLKAAAQL